MSLSDEDRRALDEIERALEREDPHFAATVSTDRFRRLRRRWVIIPGCLFLLGAVLLVAGLVTTHALLIIGIVISTVGVLTMAAGAALFLRHHHI